MKEHKMLHDGIKMDCYALCVSISVINNHSVSVIWYCAQQNNTIAPEEVNVNVTVDVQAVCSTSWPRNCIRTTPRQLIPMVRFQNCNNSKIHHDNESDDQYKCNGFRLEQVIHNLTGAYSDISGHFFIRVLDI